MFILAYLNTYTLQVVHGRLFGMVQGKAHQWIHVLLPVLLAALRTLGDARGERLRGSRGRYACIRIPVARQTRSAVPPSRRDAKET